MKIVIGSDHRGVEIKRRVVDMLHSLGHDVLDVGSDGAESVDYPDYAFEVATRVGKREYERGLLICGTGIGMCIAANKVHGVRAAACQDVLTAETSRRHNDANVLCLSADLLGEDQMTQMIRIWLDTPFEGGRHLRRVEKIAKIEAEQCGK
ncbi:MAG: ribose 5-phosphate isomerase B [Planctomycetes bacterium]|nr:ribose 5-phosphate isomerase B [Planctomycetota bacterium]